MIDWKHMVFFALNECIQEYRLSSAATGDAGFQVFERQVRQGQDPCQCIPGFKTQVAVLMTTSSWGTLQSWKCKLPWVTQGFSIFWHVSHCCTCLVVDQLNQPTVLKLVSMSQGSQSWSLMLRCGHLVPLLLFTFKYLRRQIQTESVTPPLVKH